MSKLPPVCSLNHDKKLPLAFKIALPDNGTVSLNTFSTPAKIVLTEMVSVFAVLHSLFTVAKYLPVLFTVMDEVVSPVFQTTLLLLGILRVVFVPSQIMVSVKFSVYLDFGSLKTDTILEYKVQPLVFKSFT